ncbi:MAG: hypothetical protein U0798_04585 [Gemmataceae bacterium]
MSKWVRSFALMSAMAVLSTGTITLAQDKGKGTTPPTAAVKKGEKAPAAKAGSIEYYQNAKGKWRYIIKDEDGKSVAMPLAQISYDSKEDCLKAIEALKKTLNEAKPTERKEEKEKK